jgi:CRISPR-associated protein Cmr3
MTLHTWLFDPAEPLVFGDGRPATAIRGHVQRSRELPPPTQVAGVVRTRAGTAANGLFEPARIDELRGCSVLGPHLVRVCGDVAEWLFPGPADVTFTDTRAPVPLVPLRRRDGERTSGSVEPVGPVLRVEGKPPKDLPRWWTGVEMLAWLAGASSSTALVGDPGPKKAPRTHVVIDPHTGTAEDGALFGTEGRVFADRHRTLCLAVRTDAALAPGLGAFAGERRLGVWREGSLAFPALPAAVLASAREGAVRVLWVTPAHFAGGASPAHLVASAPPGSRVVAQVNGRPEVVSGYDLQTARRKPTRRLLPAGSVTWLELGGGPDERERWVRQTWGAAMSDTDQDRRDGLGVVLLGTWDGTLSDFDSELCHTSEVMP